jgi:hypothetical protein
MIYPSTDTSVIKHCDNVLKEAMEAYCFLDIDYRMVSEDSAMLIIDPCVVGMWPYSNLLGVTFGSIHVNPLLYPPTKINLSCELDQDKVLRVLIHELYHAFTVGTYHNIDPESIMYEVYSKESKFTRQDSLYIINIFKYTKYAKLR